MSLLITPVRRQGSLWQAVCEDHGVLVRAVAGKIALLTGRLHDWEGDYACGVRIGGLRCMFCYAMLEVEWWLAEVAIACDSCARLVLARDMVSPTPMEIGHCPPPDWTFRVMSMEEMSSCPDTGLKEQA